MPYSSNDQLPPGLKELPEEAKTIFRKAFNAALGEYKDEVTARKVAWAAVKGSFKKDDSGKWIKKIKAFLSLQCLKLSSLSSDDILALVDPQTISRIKAMDAHPFFQAYSICHEGVSQPTILGEKSKPIHWTRAAVESIKNVVRKGIKFFRGHNKDNATEGREALGEIVADTQKEIDGKLHHVVIGYFPDKAKVADADVCSQEADWNLIDYAGKCIADTMRKLTGIALSNSSVDKPAFEGAVRLGMVQAFDIQAGGPGSGRRPYGKQSGDTKTRDHANNGETELSDSQKRDIVKSDFSDAGIDADDEMINSTIKSVTDFTDGDYRRIRSDPEGEKAQAIEKYIEAAPKYSGDEIYRGIGLTESQLSSISDGDIIDMKGISSWSSDKDKAEEYSVTQSAFSDDVNIAVVLTVRPKTAVSITHLTQYPKEKELLYGSKTKFKVLSKKKYSDADAYAVEVEEI
jgi:cation transport regulator